MDSVISLLLVCTQGSINAAGLRKLLALSQWVLDRGDFLNWFPNQPLPPRLLPTPRPFPLSLSGPFPGRLVSRLSPQGSPPQSQRDL